MSGISLDEIVFSTGAGAVDADTLRVQLSTESLAALENIEAVIADGSKIIITDGTEDLLINGDGSLNALVTAVDFDIRDLAFATDKVDVSGSTVNAAVAALATIKNTDEDVTTTAAQVVATPLADRKEITIQNEGNQDVYIGSSAGVTAANGIKISKNSSATYQWGPDVDIFMIAASGTQDVRFLEAA